MAKQKNPAEIKPKAEPKSAKPKATTTPKTWKVNLYNRAFGTRAQGTPADPDDLAKLEDPSKYAE